MRYMLLLLFTVIMEGVGIEGLRAQMVVTAAGGNATGGGVSVSFTIGQISYSTISSVNHSVSQGVQQPYEISVIAGIEKDEDIALDIIVYPNPTSDIIRLKTGDYETSQLRYRLHDTNGRLLLTGQVDDNETSISTGQLAPAAYILRIMERNISIKSFMIIKR